MNSGKIITGNHVCLVCKGEGGDNRYTCLDIKGNHWKWRECNSCGAMFLSPKPSNTELASAYDPGYYGTSDTKFKGIGERFLTFCRKQRAQSQGRLLKDTARVLDVGCGNGAFLSELGKLGNFELWGIELEGPAAQRAARYPEIHLKMGSLETSDFEEDTFDLITLFHVFEHLRDPVHALTLLRKILRPSGHLVMSFPNISSFQSKIFKEHWLHLDPPRHLFLMPPDSFESLVHRMGFNIEHRTFFSIEQNPYGLIQSSLNRFGFPRDLLYERLKGNTNYCPEHGSISLVFQKIFAGTIFLPAVAIDAIESLFHGGATVQYRLSLT